MKADFSIVVLLSGNGSNLQAIIDADAKAPYQIAAVISNRPNAYGLQRAADAGIAHHAIDHTEFDSRLAFDHALIDCIRAYQPQLVVLAGFMRKLTPDFIQTFPNHIINIHPSLLPKYPGLHTHQRAIEAGDKTHGVTIHVVTEELDAGPILAQAKCDILPNDTPEQLQKRVQQLEHRLYPQVITQLALSQHDFLTD